MHRLPLRAAAALLLVAPAAASAQPLYLNRGSTFVSATALGDTKYVYDRTGQYASVDTSAYDPYWQRSARAISYSSLRLGKVGVYASADGANGYAYGYAGFSDQMYFENPGDIGAIELFSVSVDGYAQGQGGAKVQILIDGEDPLQSTWHVLHGNDTFDFDLPCAANSLMAVNPCAHSFQIYLWATVNNYAPPFSSVADYSHTLRLGVHPAAGNSFSSFSGQLLADAPPESTAPQPTTTPEPASLALLATGVGLLAFTRRARWA